MPRFYLPPAEFQKDEPALDAGESHHALHVLRLVPGDKVTLFDGLGHEAMARVAESQGGIVTARVVSRSATRPLPCEITLAQAVPKGKNMELIVQKAVELGAHRVVPLLSDRSVVQLDGGDLERKQSKWQAVALEACKQCGRNFLPVVEKPLTVKAFLEAGRRPELPLIASLQPGAAHIKKVLGAFASEHGRPPASVSILIGPEGDFTPAEAGAAVSAGFRAVTLGPIILRTETAAMYTLSVLAHELF